MIGWNNDTIDENMMGSKQQFRYRLRSQLIDNSILKLSLTIIIPIKESLLKNTKKVYQKTITQDDLSPNQDIILLYDTIPIIFHEFFKQRKNYIVYADGTVNLNYQLKGTIRTVVKSKVIKFEQSTSYQVQGNPLTVPENTYTFTKNNNLDHPQKVQSILPSSNPQTILPQSNPQSQINSQPMFAQKLIISTNTFQNTIQNTFQNKFQNTFQNKFQNIFQNTNKSQNIFPNTFPNPLNLQQHFIPLFPMISKNPSVNTKNHTVKSLSLYEANRGYTNKLLRIQYLKNKINNEESAAPGGQPYTQQAQNKQQQKQIFKVPAPLVFNLLSKQKKQQKKTEQQNKKQTSSKGQKEQKQSQQKQQKLEQLVAFSDDWNPFANKPLQNFIPSFKPHEHKKKKK